MSRMIVTLGIRFDIFYDLMITSHDALVSIDFGTFLALIFTPCLLSLLGHIVRQV